MSQIVLSPILDLSAAAALKQELVSAFADSDAIVVDAGQVQRVGSPCMQIMVAAVRRGASIINASDVFENAAILLGLDKMLKLESAHV